MWCSGTCAEVTVSDEDNGHRNQSSISSVTIKMKRVIITINDTCTFDFPSVSRSVILPKTRLKDLILIIKSASEEEGSSRGC